MKYFLLFALLAIGYVAGVFVPLMDNDAAHHAAIALEMTESGNPTRLIDVSNSATTPYLDKPHFQMWLVAASFSILGVSGIVYKLSSLIFVLLAIWATYRLGELLAPRRQVGIWAALILASMSGFVLNSSVDIRMDAIITGAVALALWQGIAAINSKKFKLSNYIFAALGMAMAFSTKGLFGVVIPALAYVGYMIGTKRLSWMAHWHFALLIAMFGVMITPVLWAYYAQFGSDGVSFILYGQIFSRIGGAMGSAGASDPAFFLHTILWVVLPWSALFYLFLVRSFVRRRFDITFWATIPTIVVMTFLLSLSVFKLPHYLNPLFPLMAIFVANELLGLPIASKLFKGVVTTQKIVVGLLIAGCVAINYWAFAWQSVALATVVSVGLAALIIALLRPVRTVQGVAALSTAASAILWVSLNANFYPQLMEYQAGNVIGAEAVRNGISPSNTYLFDVKDYSGSFEIAHKTIHRRLSQKELESKIAAGEHFYLYIEQEPRHNIDSLGMQYKVVHESPDYRITRLNGKFLNPAKRAAQLSTTSLLQF